jgi:hypothetical protein
MKPMSQLRALPSAAASWMPERLSVSSSMVEASFDFIDPPISEATVPIRPPSRPFMPPCAEADRGRHRVVGRHHLALADVAGLAQLAQQLALARIWRKAWPRSDHEADCWMIMRSSGTVLCVRYCTVSWLTQGWFDSSDGERAERAVAAFELAVGADRAGAAGGTGGDGAGSRRTEVWWRGAGGRQQQGNEQACGAAR